MTEETPTHIGTVQQVGSAEIDGKEVIKFETDQGTILFDLEDDMVADAIEERIGMYRTRLDGL